MSIFIVKEDLRRLVERDGADCFSVYDDDCGGGVCHPRPEKITEFVDDILDVIARAGYRLERA